MRHLSAAIAVTFGAPGRPRTLAHWRKTPMLRMAMMALASAGGLTSTSSSVQAQGVTAAEARTIAKEVYIYGFPMVDNYRIQHAYFVDTKNPEYKAPWNQIFNVPRVYYPRACSSPIRSTAT
jgi:hypothetical protein